MYTVLSEHRLRPGRSPSLSGEVATSLTQYIHHIHNDGWVGKTSARENESEANDFNFNVCFSSTYHFPHHFHFHLALPYQQLALPVKISERGIEEF